MILVLVLGLVMNAVALPIAARRALFLFRLISSGQPAPDRLANVTQRTMTAVKGQLSEVLGQRKLLKWSLPGVAHAFVMYAFIILASVYLEAYAVLLSRNPEWSWFIFGNWSVLGFAQDLISVLCLVGLATFTWIRIKNAPERLGRRSRFSWSHLSGAWITLFMIFNVIWTLFLFRGAVEARDLGTSHGYGKAAFVSYALGNVLPDSTALIGVGLLLHIGVMLVFLVFVLNSKHLHIFIAPLNVMFKRPDGPVALGAAKPLTSAGQPVRFEDLEDMDEDTTLGVGSIEDFSWKGLLDFATCTECGRCQSQCPAWNTEKPLSPKLLIMGLRDHAFAKAPYLLAEDEEARTSLPAHVLAEAERPLVGETEGEWAWHPEGGAVIDNDVLWSCTSCGACVQQCPVDIEHVDHIIDMRRYQVLVESNFPAELNQLFRGLENKGNPWNMSATARLDWAKDLPFDVKVVGEDVESLDEVEWLFWVGCAGAYEDRAKKTTRAVAELLNMAGVDFAVLGNGETCTGDPARRAGNEFVFQGLAAQNAEVLKDSKAKKVVSTCAHCFNTLKNEYAEFGVELEVVHHTQLLNRLVREKKLTPVAANAGAGSRSITYHDPCYLGRHNQVYSPPRELLDVIPDASFVEMPRNSERSFCCGAGGARMWMEETIGERINVNRTKEAVATGADQIAVGCPFCRVMLDDGLTAEQSAGSAREEVEVLDVAQLLLASVKGEAPRGGSSQPSEVGAASAGTATATATRTEQEPVRTEEEPKPDPAPAASSGGSLFDTPAPAEDKAAPAEAPEAKAEPAEEKPAAAAGGSLFDLGGDTAEAGTEPETAAEPAPESEPEPTAQTEEKPPAPADDLGTGSLFDLGGSTAPADDKAQPEPEPAAEAQPEAPADAEAEAKPEPEPEPAAEPAAGAETAQTEEKPSAPADEIGSGSLFDLEAPAPEAPKAAPEPEAAAAPEAEPAEEPTGEPEASGDETPLRSLKDIKAEHAESSAEPEPEAEPASGAEADAEPESEAADEHDEAQAEAPAEEAAEAPTDEPSAEPVDSADEPQKPAATPAEPKKDIGSGSLFDL